MIYARYLDAALAADLLNLRQGWPKARPVYTVHGWTVIASYAFGRSGR